MLAEMGNGGAPRGDGSVVTKRTPTSSPPLSQQNFLLSATTSPAGAPRSSSSTNSHQYHQPRQQPKTPQVIAHRGYNALYPENTLVAIEAALQVGADGIETDLHLSSDGIIVLSHDAGLKRCFGVDKLVKDCDWSYLQTLRTVAPKGAKLGSTKAQGLPMATLLQLFGILAREGYEARWTFLDIKPHDDPETMLRRIEATIAEAPKCARPWEEKVVLGCWTEAQVHLAHSILPGFPIAFSSFLLKPATVMRDKYPPEMIPFFSMNLWGLRSPQGRKFFRDTSRRMLVWTVDDARDMKWALDKGFEGIMSDDPKLLKEICEKYADGGGRLVSKYASRGMVGDARYTVRAWAITVLVMVVTALLGPWLIKKRKILNR